MEDLGFYLPNGLWIPRFPVQLKKSKANDAELETRSTSLTRTAPLSLTPRKPRRSWRPPQATSRRLRHSSRPLAPQPKPRYAITTPSLLSPSVPLWRPPELSMASSSAPSIPAPPPALTPQTHGSTSSIPNTNGQRGEVAPGSQDNLAQISRDHCPSQVLPPPTSTPVPTTLTVPIHKPPPMPMPLPSFLLPRTVMTNHNPPTIGHLSGRSKMTGSHAEKLNMYKVWADGGIPSVPPPVDSSPWSSTPPPVDSSSWSSAPPPVDNSSWSSAPPYVDSSSGSNIWRPTTTSTSESLQGDSRNLGAPDCTGFERNATCYSSNGGALYPDFLRSQEEPLVLASCNGSPRDSSEDLQQWEAKPPLNVTYQSRQDFCRSLVSEQREQRNKKCTKRQVRQAQQEVGHPSYLQKPHCAFCLQNGEEDSAHDLKDADGGVVCPVLSQYQCRLCGATGHNAHTFKFCPNNPLTLGDPVAAGLPSGLFPWYLK